MGFTFAQKSPFLERPAASHRARRTLAGRLADAAGGRSGVARLAALTVVVAALFLADDVCSWPDVAGAGFGTWFRRIVLCISYALSLTALSLLVPAVVARIFFTMFVPWSVLVCSMVCFSKISYDVVLGGEVVAVLFGSSWPEIRTFLENYATFAGVSLFAGFIALETFAILRAWRCRYFRPTRWSLPLALLLQLPLLAYNTAYPPGLTADQSLMYNLEQSTAFYFRPLRIIRSVSGKLREMRDLRRAATKPQLPVELRGPHESSGLCGVVVFGESATRNRWSLYGYGRPTTPRMDGMRGDLYVFTDVKTTVPITTTAMRFLLTTATMESPKRARYTLASVCKRAGFDCSFYSNQDHWGEHDGVDTLLFADCDRKVWLADLPDAKERYDDGLLPYARTEIAGDGNRAVFLHLMGSHFNIEDRYPPEFAVFGRKDGTAEADADATTDNAAEAEVEAVRPSGEDGNRDGGGGDGKGGKKRDEDAVSRSDHYDNSILFTDAILGELVDSLAARGGESFLVYISDHGETPGACSWRYYPDRDLWEVPMIVWLSGEYSARHPETAAALRGAAGRPMRSDQLLHGIISLFQIAEVPKASPKDNFLSPVFVTRDELERLKDEKPSPGKEKKDEPEP